MNTFLHPAVARSARLAIGAGLLLACAGQANAQSTGFGILRANIGGTAVVKSSNGVQGAVNLNAGRYDVTFSRPVDSCTTLGALAGNVPGSISTFPKAGAPNVISVRIFNSTGVLANNAFSLIVACGP